MLIPSRQKPTSRPHTSLSRRVNANSQLAGDDVVAFAKLIKKGEC